MPTAPTPRKTSDFDTLCWTGPSQREKRGIREKVLFLPGHGKMQYLFPSISFLLLRSLIVFEEWIHKQTNTHTHTHTHTLSLSLSQSHTQYMYILAYLYGVDINTIHALLGGKTQKRILRLSSRHISRRQQRKARVAITRNREGRESNKY